MDADTIRGAFSYEPLSGEFRHLIGHRAGNLAGSVDAQGYVILCVKRQRCKAHRAAWLLTHGEWPCGVIDHINGVRSDNRATNLRDIDAAGNRQNQRAPRSDNRSGFAFVHIKKSRFQAVIRVNGKHLRLGVFATAQEAHAVAVAAKRKHHAFFAG